MIRRLPAKGSYEIQELIDLISPDVMKNQRRNIVALAGFANKDAHIVKQQFDDFLAADAGALLRERRLDRIGPE